MAVTRRGAILALLMAVVTVAGGCAAPWTRGVRALGAWTRSAEPGEIGVVYLTLENRDARPVRVVAAETDVADRVELHRTVHEHGGQARMEHLPALEVPPRARVQLSPGGYHLMLMGLRRPLRPGDRFALTLRFDDGRAVTVSVQVR